MDHDDDDALVNKYSEQIGDVKLVKTHDRGEE
jgi:hypothetical protein